MYKKISEIKSVSKGYSLEGSMLTYQSGSKIFQYDIVSEKEIFDPHVESDFKGLVRIDDVLIGISGSGYAFFDSQLATVKSVTIENPVCDFSIYNEKLIVVRTDYDYSLFLSRQGIQDIFLDKVIWEADFGENIRVESNIAFTVSLKGIGRRDLECGEVKWSVEMASGKYLPELVGADNNIVVFCFKGLDKVVAFNIETGEVKWEIQIFARGLCIDKTKGLLHQMLVNYAAYDLMTGELKDNYQNFPYFESVGIGSQRSNYILEGSHILTTDQKKGVIGAFNTVTHEFDWVHKEEGVSFPPPTPIIYRNPYLLVYDNLGTLHVFEKECM
ncbi:hypothetical protein [Microbulbifer sp. VVAC002]|uniref:hypothetical protein n=1 Tax=Microbulbifer sp. VVAC002 TaxID=3243387 RepID=UPI0040391C4F